MEQKQFYPKAQKRAKRRERIKMWFSETFRSHSKEEYKEFLTRGFDGKDGINKVYPWVYARMLVLCFVLFAATTFFMYISNNAISYPTMIFLGAILVNLPFITLIYELCPKQDLSFIKLILVLVVGGTVSVILTELGYLAYTPEKGYGAVAWTAFIEELAKAIPAIAVILIMKKRQSPLTCFALAAAVGAGISIIEDMGYILFNSFEESISLSMAISTSIMRSVSGIATHTVWVGYVGWIFSKGKKPFLDVRLYAVFAMSMVLHFLWDLVAANEQLWSVLGILFGFIFCICFTRWIVKKERRLVLENSETLPLAVNAGAVANVAVAVGGGSTVNAVGENAEQKNTAAENVKPDEVFEEFSSSEGVAAESVCEETAVADGVGAGTVAEKASAERTASAEAASVEVAAESVAEGAVQERAAQKPVKAVSVYSVRTYFPEDSVETKIKKRTRYSQAANIIAAIAAIILGILALNVCTANIGYRNEVKMFSSKQSFLNFVQDGYELESDWNRPLDLSDKDFYSFSVTDGKYTDVTQVVNGKYLYSYYWTDGGNVGEGDNVQFMLPGWYLSDISVKIEDRICPCIKLADAIGGEIIEDGGYAEEEVSCFVVREDVVGCYSESIFGTYAVIMDNVVFYGLSSLISYAVSIGAVLFVGALLFIIFKVQAKNLAKQIAAAEGAAEDGAVSETETGVSETRVETCGDENDMNGEVNSDTEENGDAE